MLPLGVVLSMLGQYRVFLPIAAILASWHAYYKASQVFYRDFCPFIQQGIGGAHEDSGPGCQYWWLHGPIYPKYVPWGCSLVILQAVPSVWRCPAEENQELPEHSEVWHYRLGSGSYTRNAAWRMALRCFRKCPCGAHCRRAQEAI